MQIPVMDVQCENIRLVVTHETGSMYFQRAEMTSHTYPSEFFIDMCMEKWDGLEKVESYNAYAQIADACAAELESNDSAVEEALARIVGHFYYTGKIVGKTHVRHARAVWEDITYHIANDKALTKNIPGYCDPYMTDWGKYIGVFAELFKKHTEMENIKDTLIELFRESNSFSEISKKLVTDRLELSKRLEKIVIACARLLHEQVVDGCLKDLKDEIQEESKYHGDTYIKKLGWTL